MDLATNMALNFVELLADGEFHAARDLLSEDLKHLRSADLEQHYLSMTHNENNDEIDSDSVEICVMSSESDMANMNTNDLA